MKAFIYKLSFWMNKILELLAAFLLLTMCILVLYQVFTRYFLNNPSDWTEELVRYFLIWTCFIGSAWAFGTRQHMALLYFLEKMTSRKKMYFMLIIDTLVLLLTVFVIVIGGIKLALSAESVYSALLGVPRSLVYAVAPLSGVFIVIIQLINLYEDVREGTRENQV